MEQTSGTATAATGGDVRGKEYKKLGYSLFVIISNDKLECRCTYIPNQQGSMITPDDLKGYLALSFVKQGIDQAAVEGFLVKAAAGQELREVVIATGTPPVNGVDSWIQFTVQPSMVSQQGDENPDGESMDFHIVQTFLNVAQEDEIGRIIPADDGTPGRGITGQPIPQIPGKPLKTKIGKNIHLDETGTILFAETAGRIHCTDDEITVEEEYTVRGDVNFRVGSIVFNGFVDIKGDVLDGFNVTATKGIRISGNVGLCQIRSDGDVTLCGMDGQGKGVIISGGTLRANFLHDCFIECAGDAFIDVEIHNSTLFSLGRVVVSKGAISGGECIALGGIEVKKLGSPASVKTRVKVGVDYRDAEELEELFARLEKNNLQTGSAGAVAEIEELRKEKTVITDRIIAIRSKLDDRANPKINVKSRLYEKVFVTLGTMSDEIREERDGPVSIIENTIEGGLRMLSMTSLDVPASHIERAFVLEHKKLLAKI